MHVRFQRAITTDHLGNVRATVSDMLLPRTGNDFDADLRTLTDYYPFGMTMPGRSYEAAGINGHRYGYNGKENDNEVKGEGNSLDYGARIYDPRVGRWLSVDPKAHLMPSWTPYQMAFNSPLAFIDSEGEIPTASEAARMAAHVYDGKTKLTGGWRVSSSFSKIHLEKESGIRMRVYERAVDGVVVEYVLAGAGTQFTSADDWMNNATQLVGMSVQYAKFAETSKEIQAFAGKKGMELTFVGHSLGGGLAAYGAMVTGGLSLTFNPAGVSLFTRDQGTTLESLAAAKIDAYIMITDPLNKLQDLNVLLPDADGKRHYVAPTTLSGIVNGHGIGPMIDALESSAAPQSKQALFNPADATSVAPGMIRMPPPSIMRSDLPASLVPKEYIKP